MCAYIGCIWATFFLLCNEQRTCSYVKYYFVYFLWCFGGGEVVGGLVSNKNANLNCPMPVVSALVSHFQRVCFVLCQFRLSFQMLAHNIISGYWLYCRKACTFPPRIHNFGLLTNSCLEKWCLIVFHHAEKLHLLAFIGAWWAFMRIKLWM